MIGRIFNVDGHIADRHGHWHIVDLSGVYGTGR